MLNKYTKVLFQIVIRNFDSVSDIPWLDSEEDAFGRTGDSLDLVPIGAFYGRGKRVGMTNYISVSLFQQRCYLK